MPGIKGACDEGIYVVSSAVSFRTAYRCLDILAVVRFLSLTSYPTFLKYQP